ncbi:MAG: hypothetical protein ACM33V_06330 [Chloroflexota bacterium]|nr:hypothetical protein [Anaerolineales bacterium]
MALFIFFSQQVQSGHNLPNHCPTPIYTLVEAFEQSCAIDVLVYELYGLNEEEIRDMEVYREDLSS